MKAVSGDLPKALLPVGPRAFIDWQLQWLKRLGVTEAILALGHGGKEIQAHLEKSPDRALFPALAYRFDGKEFLGTAGAIRNVADALADDFLVTYGDSFLFVRASDLFEAHRHAGKGVTFSIFHNKGAGDTSNVIFRNGGIVLYDKLKVTSAMDHIDYGMFAVRKKYFLEHVPPGKSDLAPFLTAASRAGEMAPFLAHEIFREIGSPAGYEGLRRLLEENGHDLARLEKRIQ
ncbi:MAG: NTP transferase domain-containing protein [Deltaproteobacteria bacterium]|nr:NTP transferase domain-containing protein [Deltaproteobacteria bacterium]